MTLRDFCFRYKGSKKPNLSIKECDIPKAAVIAIVGKNGAGKSTFVRCFCGLEKKAKGFLEDEGEKYKASKRLASSFSCHAGCKSSALYGKRGRRNPFKHERKK